MTRLQSLSTAKDFPPTDQDRFVSFLKFSSLKLVFVYTDAGKNFKTMESVYTALMKSAGQKRFCLPQTLSAFAMHKVNFLLMIIIS